MLVTSRELLRIQGEVEYAVPPLAERDAVALFSARSQLEATRRLPSSAAASTTCPWRSSWPLRARTSSRPTQILERLAQRLDLLKGGRDADPRQQTLRATIEWSYDLLSDDEKQLFARLSVFAGGCTLEAAEQVCDADLDTLQSLVEKSLVRFTSGRYWMLETIREYAAERLADSADDCLWRRYARWYCALAARLRSGVDAGDVEATTRLSLEHDNLRQALDLLVHAGDQDAAADLIWSLWLFWITQGFLREGCMRAQRAVQIDEPLTEARIWGALGASELLRYSGNHEKAKGAQVPGDRSLA